MEPLDVRATAPDYLASHGTPLWPEDAPPATKNTNKRKSPWGSVLSLLSPVVPPPRSFLTQVAHATAPFISTYLLIHLSAPVLANIGGSSLMSQTILLGREYYQTPFGERYLLKLPLALHVSSSLIKRLIAYISPAGAPGTPEARLSRPRPLRSLLAWSGYTAAFLLLPIHYLTHRVYPTLPHAPIHAVGPSELDAEFVKAGLHAWPLRSGALYGLLVGVTMLHWADGGFLLAKMYSQGSAPGRRTTWRVVGALAAVPVLAGVYALWKEPEMVLSSVKERYMAAFQQSFFYRVHI